MFIGNINTIPSIVNLPGQNNRGFESTQKFVFDGDDGFLKSVTQSNYRFADALSISCWVTFGDTITAGDPTTFKNFMIVDQANASFSEGYSLYVTRLANGNALLRFQIGKGTTDNTNGRAQIRIDNISGINSSKVFLIVATFLSQDTFPPTEVCKLELKGVGVDLDNTKTPPNGSIVYSSAVNTFCIGNTSPVGNLEFDGSIDEVGVFNKRLVNSNTNDIFNWNQNGNLETYSQDNNLNLAAWYRMGENAEFTPNADPAKTGFWTMKNAVDLDDNTKNLSSALNGLDEGNLPESARQSPGLPPPT
jgi:hypothetical protein